LKTILFITSTRADFGKLKSLIQETIDNTEYKVLIVVTGMHMMPEYGNTIIEVRKNFGKNILSFKNQKKKSIESVLTKTIEELSKIIKNKKPNLIIIHGDRVETLAGAISGSLNHILTAHIEGGEVSGTIDDSIRHAVSKLSHIHFVGNKKAKKRLTNMGEEKKSIFEIGSPDIDLIKSENLPNLDKVKKRYSIAYKKYAILIWHPVTSEQKFIVQQTKKLISFLNKYEMNFIVIHPNNDLGSNKILKHYKKYQRNKKFRFYKSLRFEYFLQLLKNAEFIIGNSSSAFYEAIILKTPSINIGTRQTNRIKSKSILNININELSKNKINKFIKSYKPSSKLFYGDGSSSKKFIKILTSQKLWKTSTQKYFKDNKFIKI
jgi:UDP-N-acetylglucosamine 2-epimerase (hydrolysing)